MKKTPDTRQSIGAFEEQLTLIPKPTFSLIWPKHTTIAGRVLAELLRGEWLDHQDLITGCASWRLAAYVDKLKKQGWPIQAIEKPSPSAQCPNRYIAMYALPPDVIEYVHGLRGAA